jgi:cytochrome c oxidase subunit II
MKQDKWSRSERNGLEHGVQLPEAAAWRSNAAWLAWAAVHLEFLTQSANQCFPATGLDIRDWKAAFAAHRETSRSGVQNDLRESAASHGTAGQMKMHRTTHKTDWGVVVGRTTGILVLLAGILFAAGLCNASPSDDNAVPSIFQPHSTPAESIYHLSVFVLAITGVIFLVVFSLLAYAVVKFRSQAAGAEREPAQVYGSTQIELAWTIIPILIVVVLFLATARVIHAIQDAAKPATAVEVTAIGHQFWWEFRYPALGIVTANELHVPVSDAVHPTPTFLKLLSADTDHSFWVPQLAGKTDLIPNRVNEMWMDPQQTGSYLGQCAQYCGTQHAKMLLRVSVDTPEAFEAWVRDQNRTADQDTKEIAGRRVFETTACMNCHAVRGTAATGRFGPDLTHLMSRSTIASGAAENTGENLRLWIENPDAIKPGSLMPAMKLSDADMNALLRYLQTLR